MNIHNLTIAGIAYLVTAFAGFWLLTFFRQDASEFAIWYERTFGFPLIALYELIRLPFRGWRWLKEARAKGILRSDYGCRLTGDRKQDKIILDRLLGTLARHMQNAFDAEVKGRQNGRSKDALKKDVQFTKKRFWTAHAAVKELGFHVEPVYNRYLK